MELAKLNYIFLLYISAVEKELRNVQIANGNKRWKKRTDYEEECVCVHTTNQIIQQWQQLIWLPGWMDGWLDGQTVEEGKVSEY